MTAGLVNYDAACRALAEAKAIDEVKEIRAPDALEAFELRCWARARLCRDGEDNLHDAVDALQAAAIAYGLVARIGQDAVQEIMAQAFAPAGDGQPLATPAAPTAIAASTLDAAAYLIRLGDHQRLRTWLGSHSRADREAIARHFKNEAIARHFKNKGSSR